MSPRAICSKLTEQADLQLTQLLLLQAYVQLVQAPGPPQRQQLAIHDEDSACVQAAGQFHQSGSTTQKMWGKEMASSFEQL